MSKIQHLLGIDDIVKKQVVEVERKVVNLGDDVYQAIKEQNQGKWRMIEIELRISNIEKLLRDHIEKGR